MQFRSTDNPYIVEIWPPLKRVRVRSWAVDTSGEEPKLIYVYSEGKTQDERDNTRITVHWDEGGFLTVENDQNVTWLDERTADE